MHELILRHPSELAQDYRDATTVRHRSDDGRVGAITARVRPGSVEELNALGEIEEGREQELAARRDTFAKRRRRAQRRWSGIDPLSS